LLPLLGLTLFALFLWQVDLASAWRGVLEVGWLGVAAVLGIHALSFLADVILWLMAYDGITPSPRWTARFYAVRLIGEAFNTVTPFASMGGEPIKAQLLKDRYGIGYGASGVAFLMSKTANMLALVVFLAAGFLATVLDERFAFGYKALAGAGLAVFTLAILVLYGIQHTRFATRAARLLGDTRMGARFAGMLAAIERFDLNLSNCYRRSGRRFAAILGLAFLTWLAGIFEIWIIVDGAGGSISLLDAWIVEAVVQLVRTAAFFLPGGLGAVDVAFVVVIAGVTGSTTLGVVVAIVRRFRDLVWIAWGVALAFAFHTGPGNGVRDPQARAALK
jgi:uncharacterized protein (TIRG00374 family)